MLNTKYDYDIDKIEKLMNDEGLALGGVAKRMGWGPGALRAWIHRHYRVSVKFVKKGKKLRNE